MAIGCNTFCVSENLVFCWDAGNTKSYPGSGTTWTDIGGLNYNGTFIGSPTYSSQNGGSLVFNGSNTYVQNSSCTFDFSAGVSMECLFRSSDLQSRAQGFFQANSGGTNYINFYMPGDGRLRWETWVPVPTAGTAIFSPNNLLNNTWYHAVGTYVSGTSILYINGVNVSSASPTAGTYSSSYSTLVRVGEYAGVINGNVALARLYNRPLSASEVTQNFNALRIRFGI